MQAITIGSIRVGIRPNQVSIASIVFAFIGAALLISEVRGIGSAWPYILTAVCIQLRLLANLLDGLMAVEGGQKTKSGELYNEFPDRIADVAFLAAAGYASGHGEWGPALGWSASVLAVSTAYIRAVGASTRPPAGLLWSTIETPTHVLAHCGVRFRFRRKMGGFASKNSLPLSGRHQPRNLPDLHSSNDSPGPATGVAMILEPARFRRPVNRNSFLEKHRWRG